MSRTTARAAAMQMIFEKLSGGQGGEETLRMVYDELRADGLPGVEKIGKKEPDQEDREYITAALEGVLEHREEIDDAIARTAKGWTIDRMSLVDLTIMRLAVWEILYAEDVPGQRIHRRGAGNDRAFLRSGGQGVYQRRPRYDPARP